LADEQHNAIMLNYTLPDKYDVVYCEKVRPANKSQVSKAANIKNVVRKRAHNNQTAKHLHFLTAANLLL